MYRCIYIYIVLECLNLFEMVETVKENAQYRGFEIKKLL